MSHWLKLKLRLGLTDKLFVPFVCILLLSVLATSYLTISFQGKRDEERSQQFNARLRDQWRGTARSLWIHNDLIAMQELFRTVVDLDTVLNSVTLFDSHGNVIASSSQTGMAASGDVIITVPVAGPDGRLGRLEAGYASRYDQRNSEGLITVIIITGLVTIIVGAFVYMKVLEVVLLRRIRSASEAATAIAGRELGLRLDDKGEDELAVLARAFNTMADNLADLLGGIQKVVAEIDTRALGITYAVESQSSLSTNQSQQVSQITSTMTAMAEQARLVAASSQEVVAIADETRRGSDLGVAATDDSRGIMDQIAHGNGERVEQIGDLKRRATQVGEVMAFIEQIADQTKLIAFNASIEAAGAGEMGRRFEVVAREIRRLAANVSESAGQIRRRILDIQQAIEAISLKSVEESEKVRMGSNAALHTVTVLHNIREGANRTTQRVQEISEAINRQNSAAGELLTGLREIDGKAAQLKQGLVDLVVISSALKQLSGRLGEMSSSFVFDHQGNVKV